MREVYQNEEEANVVDDTLEAMVREGARRMGQVPPCGVKDRHPVDAGQAAAVRVSETSGRASCFAATPGVR